MYGEVGIGVMVTVIGAGVLALIVVLVRFARARGGQVIEAAQTKVQERREESESRAKVVSRSRQIREAAREGENIVVSVTGRNPAKVRWEGARPEETYRYQDLARYKRDMESRRVPHLRTTCCGRPPKLGTRRKVTT